jgi:hypothetical protein
VVTYREGQPVRQELMNRLILFYFEDGKYPGLANATVDISGWIDKVDLESVAGEQPMTSDNEFDLDSELEGVIPE